MLNIHTNLKVELSELQEVDLVLFYFLSIFSLLFFVPRVRVNNGIGHIAWKKILER